MSFANWANRTAAKIEAKNEEIRNRPIEPSKPATNLDNIFVVGLIVTVLYLATAGYKDFLTDLPWSEVRSFYLTAQYAAMATMIVHVINGAIKDLKA